MIDDLFDELAGDKNQKRRLLHNFTSFSNLKMEPNFTVTGNEKVHIRIRFNFSGEQRHGIYQRMGCLTVHEQTKLLRTNYIYISGRRPIL